MSFREDVLELMADEGVSELDGRQAEHDALQACLLELPEKQRQFVDSGLHAGSESEGSRRGGWIDRGRVLHATEANRRQLMQCVESKTQQPGHA